MFKRNLREINDAAPVRVIGLTGGIASGKTFATDALRAAGIRVVDADEVSRELTAKGTDGEKELMRLFPAAVRDGALDRRALRNLIAADKASRDKLNAYTHPLIISEIKRLLNSDGTQTVLAAPLLFETSLSSLCDAVVCITAPRKVRLQRLMARDGVTQKEAEEMIDAQIPDHYRATLADYNIPSTDPTFRDEILDLVTRLFEKK